MLGKIYNFIRKKVFFNSDVYSLCIILILKYSWYCILKFRIFMMWLLLCECCEFMGNGGFRKCFFEVMEDKLGFIGLDGSLENWVKGNGKMLEISILFLFLG